MATKSTVSKKAMPKSSSSKTKVSVKKVSVKKKAVPKEVIVINEVMDNPKAPMSLPAEVTKEFVVVHRCVNCAHVPVSVGKLVALFTVLIVLLSASVLLQVGQVNLNDVLAAVTTQVQAASHWISL